MAALVDTTIASHPFAQIQPKHKSSLLDFITSLSSSSTIVSIKPDVQAPLTAIRKLFDHLRTNPKDAEALNKTYPKRGIFKTAAASNTTSDQKYTIDLSPSRNSKIPADVVDSLADAGFHDILSFFDIVDSTLVEPILSSLSLLAGVDLNKSHRSRNVNFRLCDYNPQTAAPECDNGCGAHTDYGTFSIIFQDGTSGLELEDPDHPGQWIPVPGDATVILAGWCAVVLSGGQIRATRHRVRRTPGVRRFSAVLFVAPDLDVELKPVAGASVVRPFSEEVMSGQVNVEWFKEVMGKKWRHREGNEELPAGPDQTTQDCEIERLIWASE